MIDVPKPWRVDDLHGASTSNGRTYNGGSWAGGGPVLQRYLVVRVHNAPYGEPASVEVDMGDRQHGCTVSLNPALAREAAARLIAAADAADAVMADWREVLDKQRLELAELRARALAKAVGEDV